MWTDWREDDPKLGRHKREAFVTSELAPVVKAGLNHTSKVGQGTVDLTVRTKGDAPTNMWGPRGSEDWLRNDVISHPKGLSGTALYLTDGTHD